MGEIKEQHVKDIIALKRRVLFRINIVMNEYIYAFLQKKRMC